MIRIASFVAAVVMATSLASAETLAGQQTYDLLFRQGTLTDIPKSETLTYKRAVTNALAPEAADRDTGEITLSFAAAATGATIAVLDYSKDQKHRSLGSFPASVGNPMIMYFYETVVRDMAAAAGGSPFYIRNRIKEALLNEAEVVSVTLTLQGREVAAERVTLRPFAADGARDRMGGFADLLLEATVSPDVPGRFYALAATAPTDAGGQVPGYSNIITFLLDGEGTP